MTPHFGLQGRDSTAAQKPKPKQFACWNRPQRHSIRYVIWVFPPKARKKDRSQDVTQFCFGIKREAQPLSELISEGEVAVRRKTACTKFCDDVQ